MSSNVQYKKSKVDNFIAMYNNYTNMVDDYKNKIDTFTTTFYTVLDNYNKSTSNENIIYKGASGQHYIKTPENVLMKIQNTPSVIDKTINYDIKDTSLNSLFSFDGNSVYYTDVIYKGDLTDNNGESNSFIQLGLNDLSYNKTESNTGIPYEFPNGESPTPVLSRPMAWGQSCTGEDINRCDAYAKFTNTPYYGLGHNSGSGTSDNACECYMINNTDTLTEIDSKVVLLDTELSGMENTKYLGILMDGNMYGLKQLVYNNNFNNFYEKNDDNLVRLTSKPVDTDCHPFTGTGVNSIEIGSLGENVCALKT